MERYPGIMYVKGLGQQGSGFQMKDTFLILGVCHASVLLAVPGTHDWYRHLLGSGPVLWSRESGMCTWDCSSSVVHRAHLALGTLGVLVFCLTLLREVKEENGKAREARCLQLCPKQKLLGVQTPCVGVRHLISKLAR